MNKKSELMKAFSMISQVGVLMIVPIIGCIIIGSLLDNYFDTNVLFLIIFTIIGVLSAFRNLYVISLKGIKRAERNRSNEKE